MSAVHAIEWADARGAGLVRLAVTDDGPAWWWTYLVGPATGLVVVRDHEVPAPRQGLEVRAEGLWAELVEETRAEHWSVGLEAFGVRLDAPEDALAGELGERVPVGADLEWETAGVTLGDRHLGRVRGEVLVGTRRVPVDAPGWLRIADEAAMPAVPSFAAALGPELAVTVHDGLGLLWRPGREEEAVPDTRVERVDGADGFPRAARLALDGLLELDVDVRGVVAVPGAPGLVRAWCDVTASTGETGEGWAEWPAG